MKQWLNLQCIHLNREALIHLLLVLVHNLILFSVLKFSKIITKIRIDSLLTLKAFQETKIILKDKLSMLITNFIIVKKTILLLFDLLERSKETRRKFYLTKNLVC